MPALSVIIPTYNEAAHLEPLLGSIDEQSFTDYEVIVSDAQSDDGTQRIAEEHGATVVTGEANGPGYGRNKGAEAADGDVLLFIDADVELTDEDAFQAVMDAVEGGYVAGSASWEGSHDGGAVERTLFYLGARSLELAAAVPGVEAAVGNFIFIERDVFEAIDGFDEELPFHEDHDLIERASEHGRTCLLRREFTVSARRMAETGPLTTMRTYFVPSFLYLIGREERMKQRHSFEPSHERGEER